MSSKQRLSSRQHKDGYPGQFWNTTGGYTSDLFASFSSTKGRAHCVGPIEPALSLLPTLFRDPLAVLGKASIDVTTGVSSQSRIILHDLSTDKIEAKTQFHRI
jgi:hypothetical protein